MPSGRRRSSNGHMVIFRSPTTLVRSKVTNTPSKILARYSIILFHYWVMKGRKGLDRIHEIDAYLLVCTYSQTKQSVPLNIALMN